MKTALRLLAVITLALVLLSCIEVKQEIRVGSDGSGEARLQLAIQAQFARQLIPKMKSDIPGEWKVLEEKDRDGKHYVTFGRSFRNVAELNEKNLEYTFAAEKKGSLSSTYRLDVHQLVNSQMPFPYELIVTMPGRIDDTNGVKAASNEVRWSLQGFTAGNSLFVTSSEGILTRIVPFLVYGGIALGFIIAVVIVAVLLKRKGTRKGRPASRPEAPPPQAAPRTGAGTAEAGGPFCTQCGTRNSPDASFCINCGTKLR